MPQQLVIFMAIVSIQLAAYLGLRIWIQTIDIRNKNKEFEIKLAMTEAQLKSTSVKDFDEIIHVLDFSISFFCINESLYLNKQTVTEEELNLLIVETAASISTKVIGNLSEELLRQLQMYVTEDWLMYYVTKSAMIKLTTRIETPRS